jgi:plastocyanin
VAVRVAVAVFAVVVLGSVAGVMVASRSSASTDHVYDIPLGTRQRIEAGEDVEIVPAEMHVRTGDSLTITNDDDVEHEVGLFTIRPGETLGYTFPNPGIFRGACTVHPSGGLTIYVE